MRAHIKDPVPDPREVWPQCPQGWAEIVMQLMAKDPADRFQSAKALLNALKDVDNYNAHAANGKRATRGVNRQRQSNKPAWLPFVQIGLALAAIIIIIFAVRAFVAGSSSTQNTGDGDVSKIDSSTSNGDGRSNPMQHNGDESATSHLSVVPILKTNSCREQNCSASSGIYRRFTAK